MNLSTVLLYGGSYREEWDDNYRLTVCYEDQQQITMSFQNGVWKAADGLLPDSSFSDVYFSQAASAAAATERFLASGQTEMNLSNLAPDSCRGAVFAAECMRRLMDNHGMRMEKVYPYVAGSFDRLSPDDAEQLFRLQPRTANILNMLTELIASVPPALHDLRLSQCRNPFGAVEGGTRVALTVYTPRGGFSACTLELFGDEGGSDFCMKPDTDCWHADFPAPQDPGAYWYRFRMETEEGKTLWLCPLTDGIHSELRENAGDGFRFTVFARGFETPEWFQNSVLYQIFPDRFAFSDDDTAKNGIEYHASLGQHPELHHDLSEEPRWKPRDFEEDYIPDDFYGGTIRGIIDKLPDLRDLGITALYLNPVFESKSNHRYDTSDYLRIDPILGSNDDFEELCRTAALSGIRIICDGVFSHTGADSVYFNRDGHYPNNGACQEAASPYDSWYDFRHYPDEYRSWWGFRELPEVNENDPGWRSFVVNGKDSVVRTWLRRGASGWRLDVADELPDEVLCLIRNAAKDEKPDSLILGEVWEDAVLKVSYGSRRQYALGTALDSVMNYPFRNAVLSFLHGWTDAFALTDFLTGQQLHYPGPMYRCLMNLLGSHDVERTLTNLALDTELKGLSRERQLELEEKITPENRKRANIFMYLAAAVQFSVPGVPSIYYGDEILMTGTNDPFNRRPFTQTAPESPETAFRAFIRKLAHLRTDCAALREGKAFFLASDPDVALIVRSASEETVLTVVNRAEDTRSFSVEVNDLCKKGEIGPRSAAMFLSSSDGWTKLL